MLTVRNKRRCFRFIALLRERAPASLPVVVRFERIASRWRGCIEQTPKRFMIRITPKQAFNVIVDTIGHEWAHALAFDQDGYDENNEAIHGKHWGVANAVVYRIWEEWLADDLRRYNVARSKRRKAKQGELNEST